MALIQFTDCSQPFTALHIHPFTHTRCKLLVQYLAQLRHAAPGSRGFEPATYRFTGRSALPSEQQPGGIISDLTCVDIFLGNGM